MKLNVLRGAARTPLRRGIIAASALTLGAGAIVVAATAANAATGCQVSYTISSQWPGGFGANVAVTNLGDPLTSWTLKWTFGATGQSVTQGWNGVFSQSGLNVTVTNASWNGALGTGATVTPGFNGAWTTANPVPTAFTLNGVTCTGSVTGSSSPTGGVSQSPTGGVSSSPSVTPTTSQPAGTHLDNPYAGAKVYVNPDWSAKAAAESGGSRVSNQPTGVWLDSIAAITASSGSGYTTSLRGHLDNALAQGATLAQFVIYDLPGRDCAALASNGELGPTDISRYETEYVDPIAAIEADPKYASIRIVNVIEIDSLPNLVTNASGQAGATALCTTMLQNGNYVTGVAYALSKLHAAGSNNYEYIDAAHHGWLGWDSNFVPAAQLFLSTAQKATGGVSTVDGFITNTANYSALSEPFLKITSTVNGTSVRQSTWVDYNNYVDELTYTQAFRNELVSLGFNSNIGMLIDTSRNGWGGSARPTAASTSTDLNTWVNASRIDRRIHAGNWCNQSGAGLGARPQAAPASGIDAYVWMKPPGESDGSSSLIPTGTNNPTGKGFDQMCDPTYTGNARNGNNLTGALPNSPVSGAWFSAQFQQLMTNAYPPLS